jgi:hypothetical protein
MTFDDVMKKYGGKWEDGFAVIQAEGGYYWRIATGKPENFELTADGRRFVTDVKSADDKPRRGRKAPAGVLSVDE